MLNKTILSIVAALLGVAVLTAPAHAVETTPSANPYAPKSFMIGDSITQMGYDELHTRRPDWFVFGVGGMNVEQMPALVDHFLKWQPKPETFVIALGTNASATWTKDRLRAVVAKFPASTKVVLVTTYRDPAKFPSTFWYDGSRATYSTTYTTWMHDVAASRANTCIVPWRGIVGQNPGLLYDGVHATQQGQNTWAWAVDMYSRRTC